MNKEELYEAVVDLALKVSAESEDPVVHNIGHMLCTIGVSIALDETDMLSSIMLPYNERVIAQGDMLSLLTGSKK
jgi:hypothetical protein